MKSGLRPLKNSVAFSIRIVVKFGFIRTSEVRSVVLGYPGRSTVIHNTSETKKQSGRDDSGRSRTPDLEGPDMQISSPKGNKCALANAAVECHEASEATYT